MWHRLIRLFRSRVVLKAFAQNPFKTILTALFAALIPYLLYLFFGSLLFFLLFVAGIFVLYRLIVRKGGVFKRGM